MHIIHATSPAAFVQQSVAKISDIIRAAADQGKNATVGLSGGSTPQPIYAALATDASLPWQRMRFFLVDERYVPPDHKESNQRMIRATLLTGASAKAEFIAPDTILSLQGCIDAYAERLQGLQPDLVILGMGKDGHIASLFPPLEPEAFGPTSVIHTIADHFAVRDRISVTLPLLESAEKRLFLITGADKRALLATMRTDTQDVTMHPAVALFDVRTTWIVGEF